MKRWLIPAALTFLITGAVVLAFYVLLPGPVEATPESATRLPAFESLVPTPRVEQGPKVVYKWQDERGAWHYGDTPPNDTTPDTLTLASPEPGIQTPANSGTRAEALTVPGS